MHERLALSWEEIPLLRQSYYERYGTTLRGLQQHFPVDAHDYLAYVHDLPLEDYLQSDPDLRDLLLSLPQNRWIFTNADADHARRVLKVLGVEDCFQGIIDVISLKYVCKPQAEAYNLALKLAGNAKPEQSILLDDSLTNLVGAHQAGMVTVLVGSQEVPSQIDYAIPDMLSLPIILPELWNGAGTSLEYTSPAETSGDQDGS